MPVLLPSKTPDKIISKRAFVCLVVLSEKGFGLVFRRLAIIDPIKLSDQPMTSCDGNSTVIFNGEI